MVDLVIDSPAVGFGTKVNSATQRGTVVITGGAGYIGSLLVRRLLARSYRVRVVDGLLFGDAALAEARHHPNFELVVADFRQMAAIGPAFAGADAVIHLGGLVGDPACALDSALTLSINQDATATVAMACAAHGVKRLIFASSCSVYGASDGLLDEASALNPVSLYAQTKIASEQMLLDPARSWPAPVIMRFATVYGFSPRPRFDLVVNLLTAKAVVDGRITIQGGEQWRPFVHAEDLGKALEQTLEAPLDLVAGQIFNVGSDAQNYRLAQLGEVIQAAVPSASIETEAGSDRRDYRVSFAKIQDRLGFCPDWSLEAGIAQIKAVLASGVIDDYRDDRYNNYLFLRALLATNSSPLTPRDVQHRREAIETTAA